MADQPKPWDRLPGEDEAAYARFLTFRNMGPARTLLNAEVLHTGARKGQKRSASGQWTGDNHNHRWRQRALAWDVHNLTEAGREAAVLYVTAVASGARKVLAALDGKRSNPASSEEAYKALEIIGRLIPQEAIDALLPDAQPAGRVPPVGPRRAV